MPDPIFFPDPTPLSLADIVALTGARLVTDPAPGRVIRGVRPLDSAGPGDIAFIDSADYVAALARTAAGACLSQPRFLDKIPASAAALEAKEPARAFALVAARLYPSSLRPARVTGDGVGGNAHIDPAAKIESGAQIGPYAVVGARAEIGRGTIIGPGAVVGPDTRIGRDSSIGPGATVIHALVGNRVIIHAGARIGQDGFGFIPGAKGHTKVPQIGRVIIQDDVEIGANTCIDRGSIRDTIIGEGSKIDNLVQIAHNVVIGRHCLLAAHVGISGSSTLGDFVALGGRVGLAPHLTIGDGAQIAAGSGLMHDVPAGERWAGYPAQPAKEWMRATAALRRASRRGARRSGADLSSMASADEEEQ
jgi:UDP-3-O-[3-hydroxymyristoyl] glucosamine N-acyltransferase